MIEEPQNNFPNDNKTAETPENSQTLQQPLPSITVTKPSKSKGKRPRKKSNINANNSEMKPETPQKSENQPKKEENTENTVVLHPDVYFFA